MLYVIGMLIGLGLASWRFTVLQKQKASYQWPTTSGMIVESKRIYVRDGERSHYQADITFSYKVSGLSFVSHQVSLWSADLSDYPEESKTFVSLHPKGSEVDVYYDPKEPWNGVLIPGAHEKLSYLLIGYGVFLVLLGIVGIIEQLLKARRRAAALQGADALTPAVPIRKRHIPSGGNEILVYFGIAMFCLVFAIGLLLPPFLRGPSILLEAQHQTSPWPLIWGIACVGGFVLFSWLGGRNL